MPALDHAAPRQPHRLERNRVSFVDLEAALRIWTQERVKAGRIAAGRAQDFWQRHGHDYLEHLKMLFPPAKDSWEGAATVRTIIAELGITGRYFIKRYGGRDHIVFKGYAGARRFLTGTSYGLRHHKIIELKMTKAGVKAAARDGLMFGMLFCTVVDIVDFATRDTATWGELFGTIAGDITKGLIATGLSIGAGILTATVMGTAVIAVGPVVIAVAVGVFAGITLDRLDHRYGFSDALSRLCDQGLTRIQRLLDQASIKRQAAVRLLQKSQIIRDLSHDAYQWEQWIERQWYRPPCQFGR